MGGCKVSFRLATDEQFLFGANAADYSYALYDLRIEYKTVPDTGSPGPVVFETIHMIKTTAESNNTSISTWVPAVVQSVSMVFHVDSLLNNAVSNHLQLQQPPDVQRVEFSFNDSTTSYYNFALESQQEILYNYQQSWVQQVDPNQTSPCRCSTAMNPTELGCRSAVTLIWAKAPSLGWTSSPTSNQLSNMESSCSSVELWRSKSDYYLG